MDLEKIKEKLLKEKEKRQEDRIERWNNLKPFKTVDDIPEIPLK